MICYHHTDADGHSAAYNVLRGSKIVCVPDFFKPTNYGDKFDKHKDTDTVYIVDVSFTEPTYSDLINICKTARRVYWIDHHQSSLDVIAAHKDELQKMKNLVYFVSKDYCGAALTYAFFKIKDNIMDRVINRNIETDSYEIKTIYVNPKHNELITVQVAVKGPTSSDYEMHNIEVQIPKWLRHIDDYDAWKKIYPETEKIINGFNCHEWNLVNDDKFNIDFWTKFTTEDNYITNLFNMGKTISMYNERRFNEELSATYELEYNGTKFLCKNGHGNSYNFADKIHKYDAVILYHFEGSIMKYLYSVYSSDASSFDCKAFCEKFGGGGHFHASGFSNEKSPLELLK